MNRKRATAVKTDVIVGRRRTAPKRNRPRTELRERHPLFGPEGPHPSSLITVAPTGVVVALSDARMFRYPLLYLTGHLPVRFSDAERTNVRRFVDRGGLLFVDDHNHDVDGTFHKTATEELARTMHAHPTLSEIMKEGAEATMGHPIHI